MAHHGSELPEYMRDEARRLKLGATGQFPEGKVDEVDEGEIQFAVAADALKSKVYVNFGKPVAFLGMTPEQAQQLGAMLQEKAFAARGVK